jgi:calcium-dependent protein kinase
LEYQAPEVLKKLYNEKCDIWSCGIILYELISAHTPFLAENDDAIEKKILEGKFDLG